jgi:hypothetical protein
MTIFFEYVLWVSSYQYGKQAILLKINGGATIGIIDAGYAVAGNTVCALMLSLWK